MIELLDWVPIIPPADKSLAFVGEHETVTRQFFLPDLAYAEYTFYLDLAFDLASVTKIAEPRQLESESTSITETYDADGNPLSGKTQTLTERYVHTEVTVDCDIETDIAPLAKSVREDGVVLTWTVLAQQTQLPGLLRATLRAVGLNGEVKKSPVMIFYVAPAVVASPAKPILLTEHEQMEQAMVLAFEQKAQEVLDGFEAGLSDKEEAIRRYIEQKTAPAQNGELGMVRVVASKNPGLTVDEDGSLHLLPATKEQMDHATHGANANIPVTLNNLDYAVRSVGDARYATMQDVYNASGMVFRVIEDAYSSNPTISVNAHTIFYGVTGDMHIKLQPPVAGYDNEYAVTLQLDGASHAVTFEKEVAWQLGVAPSFAANAVIEVRLWYKGAQLQGVWY